MAWLIGNTFKLNVDNTNYRLIHRSRIEYTMHICINNMVIEQS